VKRFPTILVCLVASLALAAPAALGASTSTIVTDAQDGHIDGNYTNAELRSALASPLLKTYGGSGGVDAVKSAVGSQTDKTTGSGTLPFTGAEIVTFLLIGGALVLTGIVLRRTGRREDPA
jgi:hypothetical protein